jgi:16S rRNA (adenine1518-N6/adenine1519-N6)-dimethyltransferase
VGQRLGQHFLIRDSILRRIATVACKHSCDLAVEIGPGRGALTAHLLERAERVVAIELDRRLADHLRQRFRDEPRLTIVEADVLGTDLSQWGPATVVGNLPYYITSPVIGKVLGLGELLRLGVFLVQAEVARRLAANPGSREYGFLTVQTRLFATPEQLFSVPPGAFRPPPKVGSAVVRLRPRHDPGVADPSAFLRFVGQCFRQKRKTLRNNLAGVYGRAVLDALPESGLRAEQLSLEQFQALYSRLAGGQTGQLGNG